MDNENKDYFYPDIIFVLVEPAVPQNIGASVRALNTMGFDKIRLVNPQCDHLDDTAFVLAHGSYALLRSAKVYDTLENALLDVDLVIGTTSKIRMKKNDYYEPSKLLPFIRRKGESISSVAIVFGRECSGLSGSEIQQCDILSLIPLIKPYPSLNLSQSVMLYSYSLSKINLNRPTKILRNNPSEGEFNALKNRVAVFLEHRGMDIDSKIYGRITERLTAISGSDIRLMHSVLNIIELAQGTNNKL